VKSAWVQQNTTKKRTLKIPIEKISGGHADWTWATSLSLTFLVTEPREHQCPKTATIARFPRTVSQFATRLHLRNTPGCSIQVLPYAERPREVPTKSNANRTTQRKTSYTNRKQKTPRTVTGRGVEQHLGTL
jgi:hypothetical protein